MKLLKNILEGIEVLQTVGSEELSVKNLQVDSRKVEEGDLFAAIPGTLVDGHDYIPQAIENKAAVILCERLPDQLSEKLCYVQVRSSSEALGSLASSFYDHPSRQLKLVGITGTNGKTSIATFLFRIFESCGYPSGLISTINTVVHNESQKATHTTPDSININRLLKEMVEKGCSYAFMEVSSHAIDQNRITGLQFSGAVFTNLSHDHLDYHGSFKDYLNVKKRFFDGLEKHAFALINKDDRNGKVMVQNCVSRIYSYGIKKLSDYNARIVERSLEGTLVRIENIDTWVPFIGDFSVYNLLASYATCRLFGLKEEEVLKVLSKMPSVPGRFENIKSKTGRVAIVDYAHSPDALQNVLQSIQQIVQRGNHIYTVVGAGGDRDKEKRPLMGRIASQNSYRVVFTSDNPRNEDPEKIIEDMVSGVPEDHKPKIISITNRKEAIKTACLMANSGDIILIAGKGHEDYQEVNGKRHYFNDRALIQEIFSQEISKTS